MLAAAYLVKNEIDTLEDNILYHHKLGVEAFAVMDNGSTDGTRELLEHMSLTIPIYIVDRPEHTYQFHRWRCEIVHICRKHFKPSRVICLDPDEFWLPKDEGALLSAILNRPEAVLTVHRYNMMPAPEDQPFWASELKVECPILFDKSKQTSQLQFNILMAQLSPKVAVNPYGLLKLNGGNHRAKHIRFWSKANCQDLSVIHYPIRSYRQFESNVANRAEVINEKGLHIRIGDHYRRWAQLLESGRLKEEYCNFFFNSDEVATLQKVGVLSYDPYPSKAIKAVLASKHESFRNHKLG